MPDWPFVPGKQYKRSLIHAEYKGQQYGGIATPKDFPVIFAFTGAAGEQHGYADTHNPDGSLSFFGEGQSGDMKYTKGNRAIGNHASLGKDILVFQQLGHGKPYEYLGQYVCEGYHWQEAPDSDGLLRQAIVFKLCPIEEGGDAELPAPDLPKQGDVEAFKQLRNRAYAAANTPDSKQKTTTVRERSTVIRDYALARAGGDCECCGKRGPFLTAQGRPFLEVHHLRRLTDGGPDSPSGVAAICPNCHREIHNGIGGAEKNAALLSLIRAVENRTIRELLPQLNG